MLPTFSLGRRYVCVGSATEVRFPDSSRRRQGRIVSRG